MIRTISRTLLILLTLAGAGRRVATHPRVVLSPPEILAVVSVSAPEPKAQPELKFHAPPRPLARGAVTHDWRCFLGPTHNAVSTETPLLKSFPKSGPAIVWEVTKGDGYASPAVVGRRLVLFHRIGQDEVVEC